MLKKRQIAASPGTIIDRGRERRRMKRHGERRVRERGREDRERGRERGGGGGERGREAERERERGGEGAGERRQDGLLVGARLRRQGDGHIRWADAAAPARGAGWLARRALPHASPRPTARAPSPSPPPSSPPPFSLASSAPSQLATGLHMATLRGMGA